MSLPDCSSITVGLVSFLTEADWNTQVPHLKSHTACLGCTYVETLQYTAKVAISGIFVTATQRNLNFASSLNPLRPYNACRRFSDKMQLDSSGTALVASRIIS